MKKDYILSALKTTMVIMGVIGVVAILAISASYQNSDRHRIQKVKKVYAELNEALVHAQAKYGAFNEWFPSGIDSNERTTYFGDRITEFLRLSKSCDMTTNQACFGSADWDKNGDYYKVIMSDGTAVAFSSNFNVIDINITRSNSNLLYGTDIFVFNVQDNKVEPYCHNYDPKKLANVSLSKANNYICASKWVIDYNNMDYLNINENWECPNGKVLNITAVPPISSCSN